MVHQDGSAPHQNIAHQSGAKKISLVVRTIIALHVKYIWFVHSVCSMECKQAGREVAHNASVCGHVAVLKEVSEEKCEGSWQYTFSLPSSARKILVLYFPPVMDIPTRGKKQVTRIAKATMVCLWVGTCGSV